jgi:lipoate-protein ligase A
MSEPLTDSSRPLTSWRLIDTGPLDGPANMAIDEALLACFAPSEGGTATGCPALRLYGWEPPTLSLGRFQQAAEVLDLERCHQAGVPVVRRITGGGVIYHAAELTYSLVCAPHHLPPAASIKESFRLLTAFLLRFYRRLGLTADYAVDHLPAGTQLGARTPFCFAGKETYDILLNGRKIGGNAQRRLRNAIFQHGSIPLLNMSGTGVKFLREPPPDLAENSTSLGEQEVAWPADRLKQLLARSFQEALGANLVPSSLTPTEESTVHRLLAKYHADDWNIANLPPTT